MLKWTKMRKKVLKLTMKITTKSKQKEPSILQTRETKNFREFCNKIITHQIVSLSSLRILLKPEAVTDSAKTSRITCKMWYLLRNLTILV